MLTLYDYLQVLSSRVFSPETLPTSPSIRGVSTRLMLGCWANAHGYMMYMRSASHEQQASFCPRGVSTHAVELFFLCLIAVVVCIVELQLRWLCSAC